MAKVRKGYPSDVTDEEWWFVLPYLLLCREDAGQREHDVRAVFNAVRYMARSGCSWRLIPNDLPPWAADSLGLANFQVTENGQSQKIKYFANSADSLSCAILLDTTGNMEAALSRLKKLRGPADRSAWTR